MKRISSLLISACLLSFSVLSAKDVGLTGIWDTPENTGSSFSLILTEVGNRVTGYHIAIAHHGNRIDAVLPQDGIPSIRGTVSSGIAHINFKSGYSDVTGEAEIILKSDKIAWTIIKVSEGGIYIPKTAILYRRQKAQQGAAANP